MAYNDKAILARKCCHVHPDGRRCRAWAMWNEPQQLCNVHAGRHHRGPMPTAQQRKNAALVEWHAGVELRHRHANVQSCRCAAYAWPHRPGGGLCRWPEPPLYQRTTRSGTHRYRRFRLSTSIKKYLGITDSQFRRLCKQKPVNGI